MIYNENSYILISKELWKLVCDKEKEIQPPISYQIISNKLVFHLDDKIELTFNQAKQNKKKYS